MQENGTIFLSKNKTESGQLKKIEQLIANKKKLYQIFSFFPLQLAPDQLIIDTQKVTIIYNQFLGDRFSETILLDQIGDVDLELGFLFGSLNILSLRHEKKWIKISQLKRDEVLRAKRIIEGLIIAKKEGISLDNSDPDLVDELEKLGSAL
jgi:hypothetical protein